LLENDEIRGLIDNRSETIGRKIRDAELDKIPFMLVIGEQESNQNLISVRSHGGEDYGKMKVEDFVRIIKEKTKI
jgi:threonyl-tRNA synthetase